MSITQKDIDLLLSHNKKIMAQITLYDDTYSVVDELSGKVKSVSGNQSSDSNIRSTYSLTLTIPDKNQIDVDFQNTWIKRMVELQFSIYDEENSDYQWYSMGRMLMKDGKTTFSSNTQEVKVSLVDMMAALTEDRGSQMGTGMLFPVGSSVRDSLIAVVTTFSPYKRYDICSFDDTIPYDITIGIGQYPYDALRTILDLFPQHEMFYNASGVFVVREIPTKIEDPIDINADIIDTVLISENTSVDFSKIKNTTEIWGRSLDAKFTALRCTSDGSTYELFIDETFEALEIGDTYSFTPDETSVEGQSIKIQDTEEYEIYTESGSGIYTPIEEGTMQSGIPYCVRYADEKFVLQGELEIHVIVQEIDQSPSSAIKEAYKQENDCRNVQWLVNEDSPFACTVNVGQIDREVRRVLEGGEYSSIYSVDLAYERAKYENWLTTRMQDVIDLEMILIPWMELNDKIQYTSHKTNTLETCIVQSIEYNFNTWTMTVHAMKFYPVYPW